MEALDSLFEQASQEVKTLNLKPTNNELLQLYALFKQATLGDVTGERPAFTDIIRRAKYDAWAKLAGTTKVCAQQSYIDCVESLKNTQLSGADV